MFKEMKRLWKGIREFLRQLWQIEEKLNETFRNEKVLYAKDYEDKWRQIWDGRRSGEQGNWQALITHNNNSNI